jgi:hypothetical protein
LPKAALVLAGTTWILAFLGMVVQGLRALQRMTRPA